jgi:S1-C subfamily serine protease
MSKKILFSVLCLLLTGSVVFARGDRDSKDDGPHIYVDDFDLGPVGEWREDEPGLLVLRVMEDSPADKAGIQRGDILLSIDDQEVASASEVREILEDHKGGDKIRATVKHGDETKTVEVTLEDRLYRAPLGVELASTGYLGSLYRVMPRYGHAPFVLDFGEGGMVFVREVVDDGPADAAGLKRGDLIVGVDGEELTTGDSFVDIVRKHKPGEEVVLKIKRRVDEEFEEMEIAVTLGESDDGDAYLGVSYLPLNFGGRFHFELPKGFEVPEDLDIHPYYYVPRGRMGPWDSMGTIRRSVTIEEPLLQTTDA